MTDRGATPHTGDEQLDERLEGELEHADENKQEKDAEWREAEREIERTGAADRPEDYPEPDGRAEFPTQGEDEAPPPGSPEHDRGIVSGP